jgi:hypothetical protein
MSSRVVDLHEQPRHTIEASHDEELVLGELFHVVRDEVGEVQLVQQERPKTRDVHETSQLVQEVYDERRNKTIATQSTSRYIHACMRSIFNTII